MWENSFRDGNTGTVEILKLYSANKNPKKTLRFPLEKCRIMRRWHLIEGNPDFPTSFLLLVPLSSASYLLHDNSSRSDKYLFTNFIIYWQIYTLTFTLNLSLSCRCKTAAERNLLTGWAPMYLTGTPQHVLTTKKCWGTEDLPSQCQDTVIKSNYVPDRNKNLCA